MRSISPTRPKLGQIASISRCNWFVVTPTQSLDYRWRAEYDGGVSSHHARHHREGPAHQAVHACFDRLDIHLRSAGPKHGRRWCSCTATAATRGSGRDPAGVAGGLARTLLDSVLSTRTGDAHDPGDLMMSPNWPGVAPDTRGMNNAFSPRYLALRG